MSEIWQIITHHSKPAEAAEEWLRLGICAIGYVRSDVVTKKKWLNVNVKSKNELKNCAPKDHAPRDINQVWKFSNEMKEGHLVLANIKNNTIAYVGEVKGPYEFKKDNTVGNPEGFGYPRQRMVKWWKEPQYFDCRDLPGRFAEQFGKRGVTVQRIDPGTDGFEGFIKILKECAISGSKMPGLSEDLIKAGIVKYLYRSLNVLEPGLKIKRSEPIIQEKRPDFIAEDIQGKYVIIECKGTAKADAVEQIQKYEKEYGKGLSPRLIVVAYRIDQKCVSAAKKAGNVELFECDLDFHRIL